MGWVSVLVALGHSSHKADQQGALHLLAGKSYGLVSLWLLAVGFAGYALWRLSEAAFGVTGERRGAGPRLESPGVIIVVCGVVLVLEGARKKFMKYLQTFRMSAGMRRIVDAAVTHKASESGGIDKALLTLREARWRKV